MGWTEGESSWIRKAEDQGSVQQRRAGGRGRKGGERADSRRFTSLPKRRVSASRKLTFPKEPSEDQWYSSKKERRGERE